MITVAQAEQIIRDQKRDFGVESVPIRQSAGRVLAEELILDRPMPPFDRVTMDGIAVRFDDLKNSRQFDIVGTQAAGQSPIEDVASGECIQIMTGAAMPTELDTIIPVEELKITNGRAIVQTKSIERGQFIHLRGVDCQSGVSLITPGTVLQPAHLAVAASIGKSTIQVRKLPRILVVTTGDELVDIDETPTDFQIRRSNNFMLEAALQPCKIDFMHLSDDADEIRQKLRACLQEYQVIILSGGVSKGEFDFIPQIMSDLSVKMLFHGVKQKPGKPFWFGVYQDKATIFALPGNPVSSMLCAYRYVMPWLRECLGLPDAAPIHASLQSVVNFEPKLTYFLQAKITFDQSGNLQAQPITSNGSGDFFSMMAANGFLELPADRQKFAIGESHPVIRLSGLFSAGEL